MPRWRDVQRDAPVKTVLPVAVEVGPRIPRQLQQKNEQAMWAQKASERQKLNEKLKINLLKDNSLSQPATRAGACVSEDAVTFRMSNCVVPWAERNPGYSTPEHGHLGLWLDEADFLISFDSGTTSGRNSMLHLGEHGSIRDFREQYTKKKNGALKKLLRQISGLNGNLKVHNKSDRAPRLVLLPLQSFENAILVSKHFGYRLVKGWAVYDILSMNTGEAYLAERYWWNVNEEGVWVDYTPRPINCGSLLLVESDEVLERKAREFDSSLDSFQIKLKFLRFDKAKAVVTSGADNGSVNIHMPLRSPVVNGGASVRAAMAAAGMGGALAGQLGTDVNHPLPVVLVLSALLRSLTESVADDASVEVFVQQFGVFSLIELLRSDQEEVAALAAWVLGCLCSRNQEARNQAARLDAGEFVADLFTKTSAQNGSVARQIFEATRSCWQPLGPELTEPRTLATNSKESTEARTRIWQELKRSCLGKLHQDHARLRPVDRRSRSWARTIAYARIALACRGEATRVGTPSDPFVIWILGAEQLVEGHLAMEGYFKDVNFVDGSPTKVWICGHNVKEFQTDSDFEPQSYRAVCTAGYEKLFWSGRLSRSPPDLVVMCMPEAPLPSSETQALVPEFVLDAIKNVPVIVTTRHMLSEDGAIHLRKKMGSIDAKVVLNPLRSPFSACANRERSAYDDNGWFFAIRGPGALSRFLQTGISLESASNVPKLSALFWGILDIKYDTNRPIMQSVKVLESGNGAISKFSGDGAALKKKFNEGYVMEQIADHSTSMYRVVCAEKTLTHDCFERAGYSHIVPQQVVFSREWRPDLVDRIKDALGVGNSDLVVLKLCNRSRAAGVLIATVEELDRGILKVLLQPATPVAAWFEQQEESRAPPEFATGSLDEQKRHWWANESPIFLVEKFCTSVSTIANGRSYDATMRVAFVVRLVESASKDGEFSPEDFEVDWLGGYWKLPKCSLGGEGTLRESTISAARTSGTAPVSVFHLHKVYAALGDSVHQLFGGVHANIFESDSGVPAFGVYLKTRNALARGKVLSTEELAKVANDSGLERLKEDITGNIVRSYISRASGALTLQSKPDGPPEIWKIAQAYFSQALETHPHNSIAWYFSGMAALQTQSDAETAVRFLRRSLLLDPDFKTGYVNLAVGYLRLREFEHAISVSNMTMNRFPDTPQVPYHIAVASYHLALENPNAEGAKLYTQAALVNLETSRKTMLGRRRQAMAPKRAPWTAEDDQMWEALQSGSPLAVELPWDVGWKEEYYRLS